MRLENKLMQDFLKANGVTCSVRYHRDGSMRGSWYLYDAKQQWTLELRDKLVALGFTASYGELNQHSGNGGTFSVCVYGHREILEQANAQTASALGFSKQDATAIRESAGVKERADCTVRATSAALGIPYADAHAKLKSLGRENRRGFEFDKPAILKALGLGRREWVGGCPLKLVLPQLQTGRHIVLVRGHVFAVEEGKVLDSFIPNPNQRVFQAYQVQTAVSA